MFIAFSKWDKEINEMGQIKDTRENCGFNRNDVFTFTFDQLKITPFQK